MLETEIGDMQAGILVRMRPLDGRRHRRRLEAIAVAQQLLLDPRDVVFGDECIRAAGNEIAPVTARLREALTHEIAHRAVIRFDDCEIGLIAVFVGVDIEFGHSCSPP